MPVLFAVVLLTICGWRPKKVERGGAELADTKPVNGFARIHGAPALIMLPHFKRRRTSKVASGMIPLRGDGPSSSGWLTENDPL